ncbi:MAG TPA: type II secretion system F family protein [Acidobacteriaceae bacterium]|jgi:tight adherence protein C
MVIVLFSFAVIFALIVSGGMLMFYRQANVQRVSSVVIEPDRRSRLLTGIEQTKFSVGDALSYLGKAVPRSPAELSVRQTRLVRAGFRGANAVKFFYGTQVLIPVTLVLISLITGFTAYSPFFAYAASLGLGYLLPDFWLGRQISKRQEQIRLGLPDVLDFLVICIEAGLSMDQATARTADELRMAHPAVSDELDLVVLEQRAGRARSDSWKQFAERSDVESVRNLVSVLVQSETLGASVAKTLRIHSDTLRSQRRQQVEERAAKTTVKLVFPLVLLIFPSLFLVTLGPEAIIIAESFGTVLSH